MLEKTELSLGKNFIFEVGFTGKYLIVNGKRAKKIKNKGNVRIIYRWDDFIIKIDDDPSYRNERSQGIREVNLYRKMDDCDKKYFSEPIDYGIFENGMVWVVSKFEKLVMPTSESEKIWELSKKYDICDIENWDDDGFYFRNWALLEKDGQLVPFIYDYAI